MPAHETTMKLPQRWGDDELSKFATDAFKNSLATFVHKREETQLLVAVDKCFHLIAQNLSNPPNFLVAIFLARSHSAFRAAARLATSGQIPESYVLLRSCIEYALYGLHIHINSEAAETWILRHDDESAQKSVSG